MATCTLCSGSPVPVEGHLSCSLWPLRSQFLVLWAPLLLLPVNTCFSFSQLPASHHSSLSPNVTSWNILSWLLTLLLCHFLEPYPALYFLCHVSTFWKYLLMFPSFLFCDCPSPCTLSISSLKAAFSLLFLLSSQARHCCWINEWENEWMNEWMNA